MVREVINRCTRCPVRQSSELQTRPNPIRVGVGNCVRASLGQTRAALDAPRFCEARWLPASGVRVNSPRSVSRENTAAIACRENSLRHAPRHIRSTAALHAPRRKARPAKRPRGLRRSKSGMRLRSIFPAAKKRASRKNALRSARRQRVGRDRPGFGGPHLPLARRGPGRFARARRQCARFARRLPRRINSRRAHHRTHRPFYRPHPPTRRANPKNPAHPLAPRAAALHPAADQILKSQPIV